MFKGENGVNLDVIKNVFKRGKKSYNTRNKPMFETRNIRSARPGSNSVYVWTVRSEVFLLKKSNIKFWAIEICTCHSYKFTCYKLIFFDIFAFYYGCYTVCHRFLLHFSM